MMESQQVVETKWFKIQDLVPRTLTRERAREALQQVRIKVADLRGRVIVLDLQNVDTISGSFLDELLLRRLDMLNEGLADLQFAVPSELAGRLRTTAQLRQMAITIHENGQIKRFMPQRSTPAQPTQSLPVGSLANLPPEALGGD